MTSTVASLRSGPGAATSTPPAEIHETHSGVVVLVGDRAYKAKKPVVTEFLDFSTVERRQQVCAREVELNRRLSPEAYLGVAQLSGPDGAPSEPVIVMRRYRDSARLSRRVVADEAIEDELAGIAGVLARFHAGGQRSPTIDASATAEVLTARWQQNMSELANVAGDEFPAKTLESIDRLAMQFLAGRAELLASRIARRCIVDGHGDLLADDIFCTENGPVLLDCLEFDDRLRWVDVIDDAAFLAMDLEYLGRADLAEHFLSCYRRAGGDTAPPALVSFYVAYRAVVRAKVDVIRLRQGDHDGCDRALRHLELALRRLQAGSVRMVVVGGGPGTGKTTLARALATRVEAQVISTDTVRRELTDAGVISGRVGEFNTGLYSREQVVRVYDEVLSRAAHFLGNGVSVILDGSWRDPAQRLRARGVAERMHCPSVEFDCTIGLDESQRRVAARTTGDSDATPAIAAAMAGEAFAWPGAHLIDTSRPLTESVLEAQQVCSAI